MTDRDKSTLEYQEKMCEYCCNSDKEHIGMDGTSLCKLTMTLAYCEDYGGNCMFYNVPKEHIIVPPCKVGDKVFVVDYTRFGNAIFECEIDEISHYKYGTFYYLNWGLHIPRFKACKEDSFSKTVFLTKEEAEEKLEKRGKE